MLSNRNRDRQLFHVKKSNTEKKTMLNLEEEVRFSFKKRDKKEG